MKKAITKGTQRWSEDRLQQEIFKWFSNNYPQYRKLLFHVPNGGARNGKEAAKFQRMGVVPGVSDLILLINGCYFIELKRPDGLGSQSDEQKKFADAVNSQGFFYFVSNDFDTIKLFIHNRIREYELTI